MHQCTQHEHAGICSHLSFQPWSHFSLGATCLEVPEKPDVTFPLAKSSRLGPNSLSNITSLRNKGTPHLSTLPSSRVNWEENRACLGKGDIKYWIEHLGWSEREANHSTKICDPFQFEWASPHPSSESSWKLFLSYPNLQTINSSGSYLLFVQIENPYTYISKTLWENVYIESLVEQYLSMHVIFRLFFGPIGNEMKRYQSDNSTAMFYPHIYVISQNVLDQSHPSQKEESKQGNSKAKI